MYHGYPSTLTAVTQASVYVELIGAELILCQQKLRFFLGDFLHENFRLRVVMTMTAVSISVYLSVCSAAFARLIITVEIIKYC